MQINLQRDAIPFIFTEDDYLAVKTALATPILQALIRTKIHAALTAAISGDTEEAAKTNLIYQRGVIDGLRSILVPDARIMSATSATTQGE